MAASGPHSNMLAACTTEPQRPMGGKLGPCPHPDLCDNRRAEFNFCSKALGPGDLPGEQTSMSAFGRECGVNRLVRNHTSTKNGRNANRVARHRPLVGTRGSAGAETERRVPVARLATAQGGPKAADKNATPDGAI